MILNRLYKYSANIWGLLVAIGAEGKAIKHLIPNKSIILSIFDDFKISYFYLRRFKITTT